MSQQLINAYLKDLANYRRIGGTTEGVTSEAFKDLLKAWAKPFGYTLITQHAFTTTAKVNNRVDGAIMLERFPIGYWEAKDEDDDLDVEIEKKFRRGYPKTNIIFEDTHRAVLWQHGKFVMDCAVTDGPELGKLLDIFFGYEREETTNFKKAVAQFKVDLPPVLDILREQIDAAQANVPAFQSAAAAFLKQAKETINPSVTADDVREMLIQHILTENIFAKVFGDDEFHRKNNVAQALYALEDTFFSGDVRRRTLSKLSTYYAAIESAAALITSHSEKQGFLKAIYEGFYKVYNAKAADRLGVVYTPNEIVRFMVESADWLCEKHFKKNLIDRDVEILDPATGTGTFIVELLEHFSGQPEKLKHKYAEELHANEVAILPYYVANLNIEATYNAITGGYAEFPGLCFVDTLDNVAALGIYSGHQYDLLGGMSDENADRVKRQNSRKISVVIGNPPYNAWQENYNQNNANRPYARVDQRIGATYIKEGTAQNKNSVYDMYTRFIRWASDRVKDEGVIAFIIGRKPFAKAAYDGFRKVIAREFAEIWVFDLGGDVRDNPKLSGTKHNVFGIQTGVAIVFLVKKKGKSGGAVIRYARRPEMETAEDKLAAISAIGDIGKLSVETIQPDRKNDWLNLSDNDWDTLLPLVDTSISVARTTAQHNAIFRLVSNGLKTQRDEWTYDIGKDALAAKAAVMVKIYEATRKNAAFDDRETIKWDADLDRHRAAGIAKSFSAKSIIRAAYRPFAKRWLYFDAHFNGRTYQQPAMFGAGLSNIAITWSDTAFRADFMSLATDGPWDLHFGASSDGYQGVGRYRYVGKDRLDNITDWALKQFTDRYGKAAAISKDDIFAYVYAVLHDPVYRETYALNLKREFPRIPLYPDFKRWRDWGQALLDLHIGYETAAPAALTRTDTPDPKRAPDTTPVVKLKSDPDKGIIVLDADTQLSGVPLSAWRYRLGNRSAIDWVLDQHKQKTPTDPTIRAKFNTYRFADYKETVVDLLARVVTVSVETVAITDAMAALPAGARELPLPAGEGLST
ncbi:N-6 DNA methylase [Brevundimonas sp. AJA228-03]|uniref:type ISP restriction/modification enzyme n=1 Tax=Brevundimonas sp. AJA228-03 TaxID=2752515 RepID=UPI001ADF3555|nr:type ISP restriction/modification enzyme [Brevundimonas sp. AJA228-03]QTN19366.1 N-6 DNA methylase [Brevundimonas sp. AJA228-03]